MIHPWDKRTCSFDAKDTQNDCETNQQPACQRRPQQLPCIGRFPRNSWQRPLATREEVGGRGIVTCPREGQYFPWPLEAPAQRGKGAGPAMEPGAQPSRALGEGKAEPQQQAPTQRIEGHGQVVLLGELWKQDECCVTLQNILEQDPTDPPSRPSSIRATSGHMLGAWLWLLTRAPMHGFSSIKISE